MSLCLQTKGAVMGNKKGKKLVEKKPVQLTWDTLPLRKFIKDELKTRNWDRQKLSKEMDVSHTKVGRLMRGETNISLAFLEEFSRATDTDIRVLVALIFPGLVHLDKPDVLALAEMILKLSPDGQRKLKRMIISFLQDEGGGEDSK